MLEPFIQTAGYLLDGLRDEVDGELVHVEADAKLAALARHWRSTFAEVEIDQAAAEEVARELPERSMWRRLSRQARP